MPDFLSIPGNIRQQYMPFTLQGPGRGQLFTFKKNRKVSFATGYIHPFSKQLETLIEKDSSIQYTHGPNGSKKVTYDEFLDLIPSIQIREYMPDAKLTQMFKWFSYFKKGFDAGLQNIDTNTFDISNIKKTTQEVMRNMTDAMKNLTSGNAPLLNDVLAGIKDMYQDLGFNIGSDDGNAVLFLPFILYYRLTTTHTNNIYEIPYSMQNEIMKSDGTYGWSGGNQSDFGLIDKGVEGIGNSALGRLLLGNTIRVNMMPSFQPTGEARGETFSITIDLVNDSAEAAVYNFLMCHTLFGNNRWLQYGFVQAGASLYDIKLPGANRYMMCSGQFSCKGKGVFRTPNDSICDAIVNCVHPKRTYVKDVALAKGNDSLREGLITAIANSEADKLIVKENAETTALRKRDTQLTIREANNRFSNQTKTKENSSNTGAFNGDRQEVKASVRRAASSDEQQWPSYSLPVKYKINSSAITSFENDRQKALNLRRKVTEIQEIDEKLKQGLPEIEERQLKDKRFELINELIEEGGYSANMPLDDISNDINSIIAVDAASIEELKKERQTLQNELIANGADIPTSNESLAARYIITSDRIKDLIKIPDVYSLTLTFNSLLPDNFNNYLFGFRTANLDPIMDYANGGVDERGVFEKLVDNLEVALLKKG